MKEITPFRIALPMLPQPLETSLSPEELLSFSAADGGAVYGCSFSGAALDGALLEKTEWKGCQFEACSFSGAQLRAAWFSNCIFVRCDFSSARGMELTLQRCSFTGCRFTGANFAAGAVTDVLFDECAADYAVFAETLLKNVRFSACRLQNASFSTLNARSRFAFSHCDLRSTDFAATTLRGQNLTTCELEGIAVTDGGLRGARVTAVQACELARLLGIIIADESDE